MVKLLCCYQYDSRHTVVFFKLFYFCLIHPISEKGRTEKQWFGFFCFVLFVFLHMQEDPITLAKVTAGQKPTEHQTCNLRVRR